MTASPAATPRNRLRHETSPYLRAARRQSGRLVSVGQRSARARAAPGARRSCCRSATRRATGATSWRTSRSRIPPPRALMNELFVNIKVDREERPDLDRIYQIAHQMLTQRGGGWPLTMFLSPRDQRPFFGGTYFPPEPRSRHAGVSRVLDAWREFYPRARRGHPRARAMRSSTSSASCCRRRPRRCARSRAARAWRARRSQREFDGQLRRLRRRAEVSAPDEHRVPAADVARHGRRRPSPICRRSTWRR